MNCLFCKIARGEIPCHRIYENKKILAFLDVNPHAQGHTVVIPKKHAVRVFELNEDEQKEMFIDVVKVMKKIDKVLNPDGFNVGWNQNTAGGQVVPHLHIHILPRYINDGGGSMHSVVRNPGDKTVEKVAEMFKKQA